MQKTLEEIMSKRHREGLASTVAGMSIMTSSSPQTSRSSTANPPAHRV